MALIGFMHRKAAPCVIFDTHAGCGLYDLSGAEARKTGEADSGIRAFLNHQSERDFPSYLAALVKANPGLLQDERINQAALQYYPGSPFLIAENLRPGDRYVAAELHPEDFAALKRNMGKNAQIQCHNRDGFEAVCAMTPPPERRGLVLIDPPYELPDEYERIVAAVSQCHRRWPGGIFAVWYGIKDRPAIRRFHAALRATGIGKQLVTEFIYGTAIDDDAAATLHGSGMVVINPPWKFAEEMRRVYPLLHAALGCAVRESEIAWLADA